MVKVGKIDGDRTNLCNSNCRCNGKDMEIQGGAGPASPWTRVSRKKHHHPCAPTLANAFH
eukprot:161795-Pelagomonas_calceolata.AAC.2